MENLEKNEYTDQATEQVTDQATEQVTDQATEQVTDQATEQVTKRGRGRPKKNENSKNNYEFEFAKDFEFFNSQTVETETETDFLTSVDLKNQLLFLDGFICLLIEKLFKKKISRMEESEAEFIASLAPQDLSLLKPSKTTFYTVLTGYYLSKALF